MEYAWGDLLESYIETGRGLVQRIRVIAPPRETLSEGPAPLHFELVLTGNLSPKFPDGGQAAEFLERGGIPALSYGIAKIEDAAERYLAGHLEPIPGPDGIASGIRLVVYAMDAVFPIEIDLAIRATGTGPKSGEAGSAGAGEGPSSLTLAPPPNDTCGGAEVIPAGGPFPHLTSITADITDATTTDDPPPPSCQPFVSRSIWYRFTPSTTASYTISSCSGGPTGTTVEDTVIAVYTSDGGCAGAFTEEPDACDDDSCTVSSFQSELTAVLGAGTTYYIVVWQFGTAPPPAGQRAVQLRVSRRLLNPPANDSCANAEVIPGGGPFPHLTALVQDITDATGAGDPPPPSCQSDVSRSVWYRFTPAASGAYVFSSCADAPTGTTVDDTVMAVYTSAGGCAGPFTQLAGACDDDSCSFEDYQAVVSASLTAGTTYYVVLWKLGALPPTAGNTAVQLRVGPPVPPSNDRCQGAMALALDAPVAGRTTYGANDYELTGSSCFTGIGNVASSAGGRDVVYTFVAPQAGLYSFRVTQHSTASNLVLYAASSCPSGSPPAVVGSCLAAANRNSSGSAEEVMCLPLSSGQSIFVMVDEHAASAGSTFLIEVNRCVRESEPNGTPAAANLAACGLEGSISPAAEADFYALGHPASGSRVFALADGIAANSDDFDLRVTTSADTLEYDDQDNDVPYGSLAPNVGGTPLSEAVSYLRVSHFSAIRISEPYRLYAAIQPAIGTATAEIEPNGTLAQANSAPNRYFAGTLSSVSDVDYYRFTASAGDLVFLSLDGDPLRDNTPINGGLALLNSAGTVLVVVNDLNTSSSTTPGTGALNRTTPRSPAEGLVHRVAASGTYYARVTGNTVGDYLLSIAINCQVFPATDLRLTQTDSPDPVVRGQSLTYTVRVFNDSTVSAANVIVKDALPSTVSLNSATASQGSCGGANPVVCTLGNLGPGAMATVTVAVTPTQAGTISNLAGATSNSVDLSPANNSAAETTLVLESWLDSDGDGVPDPADCAPMDPTAFAIPGEVSGVRLLANKTTLQWNSAVPTSGSGTVHDVLRGAVEGLPVGSGASVTCLLSGSPGVSVVDATTPNTGRGRWYLVRARNVCGVGSYGATSSGLPRVSTVCP